MHDEYKRIVENADKAILFVHGIVGTPDHFKGLVPLVPDNVSVYNILLDGHGKGVKDFSRASMKKWEKQVATAVDELADSHSEIYIVAHSMGCLLSFDQALVNPKIKEMFLLAVPLRLFLKPRMFINCIKVYFNKIETEELVAAKECYGITNDKNLFRYIGWVPRYLELFSKMAKARKVVGNVQVPCVAYQSYNDEMVSKRSKRILQRNSNISVFELENSGHFYYSKNDFEIIKKGFEDFIL